MIEISTTAQNKLTEYLAAHPGEAPRIAFSGTGDPMAPPSLALSFEEPQTGDLEEEAAGFHFHVAEDAFYFAQRMIIHFAENGKGPTFQIEVGSFGCCSDCANCLGCS